ncbi:MAG TPA: 3-dehydroquinate synthase [Thermoanaerobaculia bacterium]|nr:3-dehydroquinate synthase [Thermoanaerobaculia bacterium]
MNTIHIDPYPVHIGRDLIDRVGSLVKAKGRVFVITSTALRDRFGERVAASFRDAVVLTMEEGEAHKNLDTVNDLVTQLLDCGAKRDSMAVVVGGGVVGDTAGFAAAIFLRGIDLVHVPTTLLAQVDSSLGGKTAVNHARGKNLIGAFHPPRAVITDIAALDSLPRREMLSGVFEALKGGVIGDPELFALLESPPDFDVEQVVLRAIRVKAGIVSADEKEADLRRLLNYGHTIGHGIEAALHYEQLTHGEAVAWGMIAANAVAERRGLLDGATQKRIDDVIRAWQPAPLPPLSVEDIVSATEHDKKNTGSARIMILPQQIGRCAVVEVSEDDVRFGIAALGL